MLTRDFDKQAETLQLARYADDKNNKRLPFKEAFVFVELTN
jgi:hypothetical protein